LRAFIAISISFFYPEKRHPRRFNIIYSLVDEDINLPEKRHPRRFNIIYSLVDEDINLPEKRHPRRFNIIYSLVDEDINLPEKRRPRRSSIFPFTYLYYIQNRESGQVYFYFWHIGQ